MTKPFKFPIHLRVSPCSALLSPPPCAALPQINNLTRDQSTPTQTARRNYISMDRDAVNPGSRFVSLRREMPEVV